MALRYFNVSATGLVAETLNNQAALITAVDDAIVAADAAVDAVVTANAEAGAKADVSTELAALIATEIADLTAASAAVAANQPAGALVITVDTASVTTLNKLRTLLDAVYNNVAASNLLPGA